MKQRSLKTCIKIIKLVQKEETVFELFLEKKTGEETVHERIVLTGEVLADFGILKPMELEAEVYQQLIQQKSVQTAYDKAIHYLGYRKRSVEEVRRFLVEKACFSQQEIGRVIAKLVAQNYLNDDDFVCSYIKTAIKTTLNGPQKLERELAKLGCDGELVRNRLTALFPVQLQEEQLTRLFEKMSKKKYMSSRQLFDKYNEKAVNLGYSYDVINRMKTQQSASDMQVDTDKIMKMVAKDYERLSKKQQKAFEKRQRMIQKLQTKGISYDESNRYIDLFYQELGIENDE